jgi:hypothetical protein
MKSDRDAARQFQHGLRLSADILGIQNQEIAALLGGAVDDCQQPTVPLRRVAFAWHEHGFAE